MVLHLNTDAAFQSCSAEEEAWSAEWGEWEVLQGSRRSPRRIRRQRRHQRRPRDQGGRRGGLGGGDGEGATEEQGAAATAAAAARRAEQAAAVAAAAAALLDGERREFNLTLAPELKQPDPRGVEALSLCADDRRRVRIPPAELARRGAQATERQAHPRLCNLPQDARAPLAVLRRAHTLLITNDFLDEMRAAAGLLVERRLVDWLRDHRGAEAELFYAHALRQSPESLASTGLDVHQDTEEFDFIGTPSWSSSRPTRLASRRRCGRRRGGHFEYGAAAGAAGCFNARLHHASVEPQSQAEHLKIAFFFRHRQQMGPETSTLPSRRASIAKRSPMLPMSS